jgi:hypothetical protein
MSNEASAPSSETADPGQGRRGRLAVLGPSDLGERLQDRCRLLVEEAHVVNEQ